MFRQSKEGTYATSIGWRLLKGIDYFCDLRVEVELALSRGDRRSVRVRECPGNVPSAVHATPLCIHYRRQCTCVALPLPSLNDIVG